MGPQMISERTSRAGDPRITLFLPDLAVGGGQRNLLALGAELQDLGRQVELVVGDARGPLRDAVPEDLPLHDLQSLPLRYGIGKLARHLRRQRPTHLISTVEHASVAALLAARLSGVRPRVIVRIATTLSGCTADRGTTALMRRLYPRAAALVANSAGAAADAAAFLAIAPSAVRVLPNLLIGPDLPARVATVPAHPWFRTDDVPVLLSVGRLAAEKDYPLLLDAFNLLRRRRPARLVILGDGPERPALEAQTRRLGIVEDVDLPGFAPDPYPYMGHARVFVLSSRVEGMPNALAEAMACGATLVSTDCRNGPRELLGDGRYGILTPVGDVAAMAAALEEALDHPRPAPREAWARHERAAAAQAFDALIEEVGHGVGAA